MLSTAQGFQGLLKEGSRHFSGLEEAILRNIEACKGISDMTKTSYGPNGAKKMIINHLEKIFVTSDAATIMREMDVNHPAAKMVSLAAQMQEQECGDGTHYVVALAGELLNQAEGLIKMGLHPSQIVTGYEQATKAAIEFLKKNTISKVSDIRNVEEVTKHLRSSVVSKLPQTGEFFSKLIVKACIQVLPENPAAFNTENVRIVQILGASTSESTVLNGFMIPRNVETPSITSVSNPRIAVYACPLDTQTAETKGTVVIKTADELMNYTKSEEDHAHKFIKQLADANITCVVVGGTISDLCLHYLQKYKIMAVKTHSKFELKRAARALSAEGIARMGAPTEDEIGTADKVFVKEIGSQKVVVFERNNKDCKLASIVLRGSTNGLLQDIERAIDDGVCAFRNICKSTDFVAGAGGAEIQLAKELEDQGSKITTLDQYSFKQYGKAFEIFPRILAENAGMNGDTVLTKMFSSLANGVIPGIQLEDNEITDVKEMGIYDNLNTKVWAIQLASDAAITVLKVDQIIIAKPAGGPKPKSNAGWDNH